MARIQFHEDPQTGIVEGSTERHGITFMTMRLETGNGPGASWFNEEVGTHLKPRGANVFNVQLQSCSGAGINETRAFLTRQKIHYKPISRMACPGTITLLPSKYDPWAEISVKRIIGSSYLVGNVQMWATDVEVELDLARYAPLLYHKYDFMHLVP